MTDTQNRMDAIKQATKIGRGIQRIVNPAAAPERSVENLLDRVAERRNAIAERKAAAQARFAEARGPQIQHCGQTDTIGAPPAVGEAKSREHSL